MGPDVIGLLPAGVQASRRARLASRGGKAVESVLQVAEENDVVRPPAPASRLGGLADHQRGGIRNADPLELASASFGRLSEEPDRPAVRGPEGPGCVLGPRKWVRLRLGESTQKQHPFPFEIAGAKDNALTIRRDCKCSALVGELHFGGRNQIGVTAQRRSRGGTSKKEDCGDTRENHRHHPRYEPRMEE